MIALGAEGVGAGPAKALNTGIFERADSLLVNRPIGMFCYR